MLVFYVFEDEDMVLTGGAAVLQQIVVFRVAAGALGDGWGIL